MHAANGSLAPVEADIRLRYHRLEPMCRELVLTERPREKSALIFVALQVDDKRTRELRFRKNHVWCLRWLTPSAPSGRTRFALFGQRTRPCVELGTDGFSKAVAIRLMTGETVAEPILSEKMAVGTTARPQLKSALSETLDTIHLAKKNKYKSKNCNYGECV